MVGKIMTSINYWWRVEKLTCITTGNVNSNWCKNFLHFGFNWEKICSWTRPINSIHGNWSPNATGNFRWKVAGYSGKRSWQKVYKIPQSCRRFKVSSIVQNWNIKYKLSQQPSSHHFKVRVTRPKLQSSGEGCRKYFLCSYTPPRDFILGGSNTILKSLAPNCEVLMKIILH